MSKKEAPARRNSPPPADRHTAPRAASQSPRSRTVDKPPAPTGRSSLKVKATAAGYYNHERKRVGDVFTLASEKDFSKNWMQYVDPRTREHTTGPNEAIRREHDKILAGEGGTVTTERDDDAGDDNPLDAE